MFSEPYYKQRYKVFVTQVHVSCHYNLKMQNVIMIVIQYQQHIIAIATTKSTSYLLQHHLKKMQTWCHTQKGIIYLYTIKYAGYALLFSYVIYTRVPPVMPVTLSYRRLTLPSEVSLGGSSGGLIRDELGGES